MEHGENEWVERWEEGEDVNRSGDECLTRFLFIRRKVASPGSFSANVRLLLASNDFCNV